MGPWRRQGVRGARVSAGAAIAVVLVLWSPGIGRAEGDQGEEPQRYNGGADAMGASVLYNRANLLPVQPIFDAGGPRASAAIDGTPTSAGRATPMDPGILAAGRAVSQVLGAPPELVPAYPFYADAKYPTGPPKAAVGGTGFFSGAAVADARTVEANAGFGQASDRPAESRAAFSLPAPPGLREDMAALRRDLEGLLRPLGARNRPAAGNEDQAVIAVREAVSTVTLRHEGGKLTEAARSRMQDVSLLGGVIHIDQLLATADATHQGGPGAPALHSQIQGLTVMGLPATLTLDGFKFQETAFTVPADMAKGINEAFASRGASFRGNAQQVAEGASSGTGAASVSALEMAFNGTIQPGEVDTFKLALGRSQLSWIVEDTAPAAAATDSGSDQPSATASSPADGASAAPAGVAAASTAPTNEPLPGPGYISAIERLQRQQSAPFVEPVLKPNVSSEDGPDEAAPDQTAVRAAQGPLAALPAAQTAAREMPADFYGSANYLAMGATLLGLLMAGGRFALARGAGRDG